MSDDMTDELITKLNESIASLHAHQRALESIKAWIDLQSEYNGMQRERLDAALRRIEALEADVARLKMLPTASMERIENIESQAMRDLKAGLTPKQIAERDDQCPICDKETLNVAV